MCVRVCACLCCWSIIRHIARHPSGVCLDTSGGGKGWASGVGPDTRGGASGVGPDTQGWRQEWVLTPVGASGAGPDTRGGRQEWVLTPMGGVRSGS